MERMKLFIKSTGYSVKLIYASSKLTMVFYLLLNIIAMTFPLINLYIMKKFLDELTLKKPDITYIILYISLYFGIIILNQATNSSTQILNNSIQEKGKHKYDADLAEKFSKLPLSVIDTSVGRDLINEVKYSQWTAVGLTQTLIWTISSIYSFFVAFVALLLFNIPFSLLFIALIVPGIIIDVVFERKSEDFRRKTAPDVRKFCYYRWMLTDAWPAKDVRMYDLTEPIKKRYDVEKDTYRKANKFLDLKKLRSSLFAETIKRSGEIIFIVFIILQAINGKITIGDIALYTGFISTAFDFFQGTVQNLAFSYTVYTDRMKRVFEFESIECPDETGGTRRIDKFESLSFENVYFKYPFAENHVLCGTSFTLNRGDKLSIVGINGAGKSTIIKLMIGLYQIESGQILINGYPMTEYNIKNVREMFSALFQNFVQYPLSLRDNIALSDIKKRDEDGEITEALKQSGIYGEYDKFDNDLDTYMTRQFDDNGAELSKGQWQKIALSRAYFKNADIIIFDEPSAALDAEAEDLIFKSFENISKNKTGIMISHRISSAKLSNKVIVLDGGKISESGTHEELIAKDGLYAKLYNLQMEKYTVKEGDEG